MGNSKIFVNFDKLEELKAKRKSFVDEIDKQYESAFKYLLDNYPEDVTNRGIKIEHISSLYYDAVASSKSPKIDTYPYVVFSIYTKDAVFNKMVGHVGILWARWRNANDDVMEYMKTGHTVYGWKYDDFELPVGLSA